MQFEEIQGERVPKIGLGTWAMRGQECYRAVLSALEMGYRHIDTAQMYGNEREVGSAIAQSRVDRSELFVVSKVRSSNLSYEDVIEAGRQSRDKLGLAVMDLYLIHWPSHHFPIEETMRGMNQLVEEGVTRLIGVSNFSVAEIEAAQAASESPIFTNQVLYYLGLGLNDMLTYCRANDVLLTAYTPLGKGRLAGHRGIAVVAARHGVTQAQVALRWLIEQDKVVTIPKSSNPARQRENLNVFGFELTADEQDELAG
jgi:diketogulonate reductase-like aldo/keto reductase